MKLPKVTELDPEQLDVYNAPFHGATLIVGPPGSGKTVLAFFRAAALKKVGRRCDVVMFTNVLSEYTEGATIPGIGKVARTQTMNSWLAAWWIRGTGKKLPLAVADIGSTFRPPDFVAMTNHAAGMTFRDDLDWGHLIIDEGQDFPPQLYELLNFCRRVCPCMEAEDSLPAVTVLADENQRITSRNSTIVEIQSIGGMDRFFSLAKNYRNTRQIASFANRFYVGLETGQAELPEREGELPKIVRVESLDAAVDSVVRYAQRSDNEEIAVLVPFQAQCKKYYNKLKHRLRDNKRMRVQAYISGDEELGADKLVFDKPGSVTVLCHASAKGLEFDTVFLPELHSLRQQAGNEEVLKMTLYVMCTRARRNLRLLYEGDASFQEVGIGRWLPASGSDVAVWE